MRYKVHGPWRTDHTVGMLRIEVADALDKKTGHVFTDGAYRVVDHITGKTINTGKGSRIPFYGESAWSAAERLANDLYWSNLS
jgi:hypothetical protein